jgi:TRAP-type C4-dicarboxylate transport system permease small subunit
MRLIRRLSKLFEHISTILFAAMFLMFIVGVVMRFVFNATLSWSDELAIILLLWTVFLASAFALPEKEHVSLDLLYVALPPRGKRAAALLAATAFGLLFVAVTPGTYDYVAFLTRERTPGLRLRLDVAYFCFVLFIGAAGVRLLWKAVMLLRRDWREHI